MEVRAQLNYLRMSPRKVRLVANLVRGMDARRAEFELAHLSKRAARPLAKLLASAIANAKNNFDLAAESLMVRSLIVNEGPTLKRMMPRAMGRGATIRKRMTHVNLVLATKGEGVHADGSKGSGTHEEIAAREATAKEMRMNDDLTMRRRMRGSGSQFKKMIKPSGGMVRRIFQRKAI